MSDRFTEAENEFNTLSDQIDASPSSTGDDRIATAVGGVASLYLGNILYAIERCALALDGESKPADAAFYRGIGKKLADAYGQAKRA